MSSMDAITGGSMHSSRTYQHLSSKTLVSLDDPVAAGVTKLLVPDGGPEMLFSDLGRRLRTVLDRPLPQLEVSFRNLSISVDVPVMNDNDGDAQRPSASPSPAFELPTLVNVVKNSVRSAFTKPRVEKKYILNNISGMLKPGTMTLVLGQPGSGKSSLMKILSGRFPVKSSNIKVDGDIFYNDTFCDLIRKRLPQFVSYVTQQDVHHPSLTVEETMEFAYACCSSGLNKRVASVLKNDQLPVESMAARHTTTALLNQLPALVLELLGLQYCKNTVIGDAMLRGVSGGERRRVTTGEMLFGTKLALFMDDISTGLDSAATYDIVNMMRSLAASFGTTIAISLLQPSPEVFALFDDVLLLNGGHVMYHGPRDGAVNYFGDLGFICPPLRDVADFLLDMGTDEQSQYEVEARRSSVVTETPRTAAEFGSIFKLSSIHGDTLDALDELHSAEFLVNAHAFTDVIPEFHQSYWDSTYHVFRREMLLLVRNSAFIKGRAVMIVLMGLLYSSIFYQIEPMKIQVMMGITFSATLFISLGQISQIPVFMAARDVFYKQRRSNFYRTSSLVVSSALSRVPVAIVESVVFGSLLYWMCGFSSNAASYITFELLFFLTSVAMGACFYFLTATSPNTTVAIPITLVVVLVNVTFAGFVIPKDRIPVYLMWLYWLTPMSWCIRSVMVNQYRSPEFASCEYANIDYCTRFKVDSVGEYVLSLYDVPSGRVWIFGGILYMIAITAVLMAAATYVLEYRRFETPERLTLKRDAPSIHPSSTTSTTKSATISPHTPRERDGDVTVVIKPLPEKSFVPVTLAFQDLYYSVPLKTKSKDQPTSIDLLKGVSGFAKPGTMTALMGPSGAGKTTLMDVIAGRKTGGTIRGKIFVNGYEATDTIIRRCAGYCEQMDVHSEASTFREALTFSAFLRQPSDVPDCVKFDSVYECLDLLDLHPIAEKIIRGSSMEQMKRLTIGVELAAQPSVLFLDEPTSGLDAQAAKSIMAGVRDVANTGRTVMCTIHQPSTAVFEVFDNLLLLKKGGEMVYFGEIGDESRSLITYFEGIPGVLRMERGANPATWMLECIGAGVGGGASASSSIVTDFVRIFQRSALKQSLDRHLSDEGVTRPSLRFTELRYSNKRAASELMQLRFLLRRTMTTYWRTASYNLTRIVIATAIACVFAAVFAGAEYTTYQGINGGVGMVFLSTVFCGIVSFFSVLPVAFAERASFYRERASQAYNALWYFFALSVAEIPYVLGSSLVFTLIFYPSVGFTGFHTGVLYWLNTALLTLMQTYTGQLVAFALPSEQLALLVSVLLNTIFFLFMGFNPPASAIPSGFRWLNHVVPKRYSFSILTALVFADCPADDDDSNALGCQPLVGAPPTMQPYANVREYVESVFGARHDDIARNIGVVLLAIVVIRVLGLLALRFVNHQKR